MDDLGFQVRSVAVAGGFRREARFVCRCGDTLTFDEGAARKLNPEIVAKRARAAEVRDGE